ncbi:transposase-like protein [Salinibacter ruber]|nr:transposase-like protein [Salinibacter ruber]
MNEILQAEMTEHLGAEPGEQTDDRRGYRNGSYERTLTTRIGSLKLEVPRDREGTFQCRRPSASSDISGRRRRW